MKIKRLMTKKVGFCRPEDDLGKAVQLMKQHDCGAVPVVNTDNQPVGMITDRDIALAVVGSDDKPPGMKIAQLQRRKVITCMSAERVEKALKKMRKYRIRRLPIVDKKGELAGILSIADFLTDGRLKKKLRKEIYKTLAAIGKPAQIVLREISAESAGTSEEIDN